MSWCAAWRPAFEAPILRNAMPRASGRGCFAVPERALVYRAVRGGLPPYNMPVYFRISGELDTAALEFAFDHLFARHPRQYTRTRFIKDRRAGARRSCPHALQVADRGCQHRAHCRAGGLCGSGGCAKDQALSPLTKGISAGCT